MANGHGGRRPGAGRPKGRVSDEAKAISELTRQYTEDAIKTLVDIARNGESEAARVSAANSLLDRGWGKPPQEHQHGGDLTVVLEGHAADL